ncbi:MAG: VanZ family protein [Burkholderiales bacterium]|nr:VanZ family protein [Burkholderiales bacterium]MDP2398611.1 VanZ family protein [Burkholderiales bacterium]
MLFFLVYRSLIPVQAMQPSVYSDKLLHFSAYAVLMSWFSNICPMLNQRIKLALALVTLGIALEFAQRWTGYRTFELADMAANATGVAAGWLSAPPRLPNYLRGIESFREP